MFIVLITDADGMTEALGNNFYTSADAARAAIAGNHSDYALDGAPIRPIEWAADDMFAVAPIGDDRDCVSVSWQIVELTEA